MRKNHHGKKDRLVKRVFALCLALAVICTCLVPVFATEASSSLQVNQEVSRPVEGGEEEVVDSGDEEVVGFGGDEAAGFGEDFPAVDDSGWPAVDDSDATGFGEEEATRPVEGEGGESSSSEGGTVKDSEWGDVIEYDTSSSTVTEWSGEDAVVDKSADEEVVSGDEIKKLQDMVVYRFWLKELNTLDLQDIAMHAQTGNMTESEYLAQNGEIWGLYFIQAVPRAETIADYSSYIKNPSSNQDPKGELRLFDYWYTLDDLGNRVRLDLSDPTSNILDDKTTTVNVYAAWQDGTVGSDEEEKVDHEDLVDKNPVPVDLTAKAAASYEDEEGELKTTTLPVEVKNLPSAAHSLSVIHMGDDDMESFYERHSNDFGNMAPILGLKISPKNAKGETVQPAKGDVATVTVSGLNALPEMEGATASTLKVFHETSDGSVEKLDVLTYTNGTLTFETSSFSPFVVVRTDGYATDTLDVYNTPKEFKMTTAETKQLTGSGGSAWYTDHNWSITPANSDVITLKQSTQYPHTATIMPLKEGTVTVTHTCKNWRNETITDTFVITITRVTQKAAIYFLSTPNGLPESNETKYWSPESDKSQLLGDISVNEKADYWVGDKNITDNVGSFIFEWPDGTTSGDSWTLNRTDTTPTITVDGKSVTAFNYVLDSIWSDYKSNLETQLNVTGLEKKDITQIRLVAHKISRDNSTKENQYFHIDCTLDIKSSRVFTAKFKVKYPGHTDYTLVDAKNYVTGNSVENTSVVDKPGVTPEVKSRYTDSSSGITYQLKGWYPENAVGGPYDENREQNLKGKWVEGYLPSPEELADGTVNFYAEYVPVSADLTVSKTVTGMLGDQHKAFTFQIVDGNGNAVPLTDSNIERSVDNLTEEDKAKVGLVNNGAEGKFTLVSGVSITLKNLASGEYTVREESATDYETSWKLGESSGSGTEANVTVQGTAQTLAFTNHCKLFPDTGVLLDTLPYIVILAVVAGGVALLMLRKRRKEDD